MTLQKVNRRKSKKNSYKFHTRFVDTHLRDSCWYGHDQYKGLFVKSLYTAPKEKLWKSFWKIKTRQGVIRLMQNSITEKNSNYLWTLHNSDTQVWKNVPSSTDILVLRNGDENRNRGLNVSHTDDFGWESKISKYQKKNK